VTGFVARRQFSRSRQRDGQLFPFHSAHHHLLAWKHLDPILVQLLLVGQSLACFSLWVVLKMFLDQSCLLRHHAKQAKFSSRCDLNTTRCSGFSHST